MRNAFAFLQIVKILQNMARKDGGLFTDYYHAN